MISIRKTILFSFLLLFVLKIHAQSVGGFTSGGTTYCSTTNSGFVSLTGYVGTISNWESSTDGGINWNTIVNSTPTQTYFNLAQTTCYRALVKNGTFPTDTSTVVCITIYPPSVGGTVSGGGSYCGGSGPGTLILSGNTGNVLFWEYSTNGGNTWTSISNTSTSFNYSNITVSTSYRVIVQNGTSCPKDTSTKAIFIIDPLTDAGVVNGTVSVCSGSNSGSLTLTGYTGSILRWESSVNNGVNWTPIANTTSSHSYLNLTQTTWYRAVVKSGICTSANSLHAVVTVSSPTVTGNLTGGGSFCGTSASGTLTLSGYTGSIITWLASTNNGITYTPLSNTSSSLTYTNVTTTTSYKVVIKSGGCSPDTSNAVTVKITPQTVAGTISANATVCPVTNNDSIKLSGNTGNVLDWYHSTDEGITWTSTGHKTTTYKYSGLTDTTWFMASVQSGNCLIDTTNIVKINVYALSFVSAGNDTTISKGQSVTLQGAGNGSPQWNPSTGLDNATIFTPLATPLVTTTYELIITDTNGCNFSDIVTITVEDIQDLTITNLITPNGDGINDSWYVQDILNFPENEVTIYNGYGQEVYHKKGYTNDWKGTYNNSELPDGTYYYILSLDTTNKIYKGSLDIMRNR